MKASKDSKLTKSLRILLGFVMVVFGLNVFLQFMSLPDLSPQATAFMSAIIATGYLWYVIGVLKIVTGIMLITNKYTPLALVLLAPFSVNVVLFHLFLDLPAGVPAFVVGLLNLYLLVAYKESYADLLKV